MSVEARKQNLDADRRARAVAVVRVQDNAQSIVHMLPLIVDKRKHQSYPGHSATAKRPVAAALNSLLHDSCNGT